MAEDPARAGAGDQAVDLRFLLDLCREHAYRGQPCRVTCTPPRCRRPRAVDCHIDSIGHTDQVNLRPLFSRDHLVVPIGRMQRVELLQ